MKKEITKILLAEDNELSAKIYREMLECNGYKVDVVSDGTYAIEAFLAHPKNYYDLILMDIQMPKLNGYDAALQIREKDSDIIIIGMSANPYIESRTLATASGMNCYITKPITINAINKILKKIQNEI